MSNKTYPIPVMTENGKGFVIGRLIDPPGILVRHPVNLENFIHGKCLKVMSQTGRGGWLAVYQEDKIKEI
jgi:hypothetical protein